MARKRDQPYGGTIRAPIEDLFSSQSTGREEIPIEQIQLPAQQPRRYFDRAALEELATSIKQHGVIQPLAVRTLPSKNTYELIAGERRLRAAKLAELDQVPVVVLDVTPEAAAQLTLIENLQREDLNPVEETEGILHLLAYKTGKPLSEIPSLLYRMRNQVKSDPSYNVIANPEERAVQELFDSVGRMTWDSFIINRLPLLKMPPEILEALGAGQIAYTKAAAIARLKDAAARKELLSKAIQTDLSLNQIRAAIKDLKTGPAPSVDQRSHLSTRLKRLYQSAQKSQSLEDPAKQGKLAKLLDQIEALLEKD